jgi:hypothetical protein
MNDLIGRSFGQYQIVEKIGAGGMATIYKSYQPNLDRYVAIKVLSPVHAEQPGFSERFQREAKAVASLHHPNILPVYDFGQEGDYSFIAMRYVEGARTLTEVMQTPRSLRQVADLIGQIAAALDHAHQQGVVHRDIKPSNVLMDGDWALLTDFGLAKMTEASVKLTGSGVGIGTPAYMSPEQGQGLPIDHRTDIYSLGVILFEMLTGQIPHDAETPFGIVLKRVTDPLPLPRSINPEIPEVVERVILKALASDPTDRFQTAGEMALALARAAETVSAMPIVAPEIPSVATATEALSGVEPGAVAEIETASRWGRIPVWAWFAVGGAVLLLMVGLWIALENGGQEPVVVVEQVTETPPPTTTSTASPTNTPLPTATPRPPTMTPAPSATPRPTTPNPTATATAVVIPTPSATATPTPTATDPLIAYAAGPDGAWQIFLANPVSGDSWRLPGQIPNSGVPTWSPDGKKVAFRSNADGTWQIYTINKDGNDLEQLTFGEKNNLEPAWSLDGTQIAFVSDRDGNKEIYVMDSDGKNQRRLTVNSGWDDDPNWSPDGSWIVFESNRGDRIDIYRMRGDGSNLVRLTSIRRGIDRL